MVCYCYETPILIRYVKLVYYKCHTWQRYSPALNMYCHKQNWKYFFNVRDLLINSICNHCKNGRTRHFWADWGLIVFTYWNGNAKHLLKTIFISYINITCAIALTIPWNYSLIIQFSIIKHRNRYIIEFSTFSQLYLKHLFHILHSIRE